MIKQSLAQNNKQNEQKVINKQQIDVKILQQNLIAQNQDINQNLNYQSSLNNLKTVIQNIKIKQSEIQQYVQNEIQQMNYQLEIASDELLRVIQQIQKQGGQSNLDSLFSSQKQKPIYYSQNQNTHSQIINTNQNFKKLKEQDVMNSKQNQQSADNLKKNQDIKKLFSSIKPSIKFYANHNIMQDNYFQSTNTRVKTNSSYHSNKNDITNNSILQTQFRSVCQYCKKTIECESIQTPCFHFYHEACLKESYQIQLQNYDRFSEIKCHCNNKLPQRFLQKNLKVNLKDILDKQLNIIKQTHIKHIHYCEGCNFFWIKKHPTESQPNQCKICNRQRIIIKTKE